MPRLLGLLTGSGWTPDDWTAAALANAPTDHGPDDEDGHPGDESDDAADDDDVDADLAT